MVVESSRPIVQVAREIKVNEATLGGWVKRYRDKHADDYPELHLPDRARLRELERENRELKMKVEFLSKAAAYVRPER
jgi:transposase